MRVLIFIVITFCLQNYELFSNRPTPSCNTNYCVCNIPLYNKKSLGVFYAQDSSFSLIFTFNSFTFLLFCIAGFVPMIYDIWDYITTLLVARCSRHRETSRTMGKFHHLHAQGDSPSVHSQGCQVLKSLDIIVTYKDTISFH